MNIQTFNTLYYSREQALRALFVLKHEQYGTEEDVFQNNTNAAKLAGLSPESHTLMQLTKHVAVLLRCASALDDGPLQAGEMEAWRESMDDISVWMSILNGMLEERFQRGVVENVSCTN